ncbi:hypothetical protein HaLaN_07661 [Haematococcus lacustris]|uniref:Uncharacterized protein n=1 Tax=Haematococcus lacustris TaxID=44745 RepID=A0A699YP37_HAELA|nr:hypothetical protein HaLaN_07661 [Haematococcus lacustris]
MLTEVRVMSTTAGHQCCLLPGGLTNRQSTKPPACPGHTILLHTCYPFCGCPATTETRNMVVQHGTGCGLRVTPLTHSFTTRAASGHPETLTLVPDSQST